MARYPTFEEYAKRRNYADGVKRCNDLLKKNPNNAQLLSVKLQLLCASSPPSQEWSIVLDQISAINPPIQDPAQLAEIEEAIFSVQRDAYPQPLTAGPVIAKLWDQALKSSPSPSYKLDVLSVKFSRAVADNRIADAQQTLVQLKVLQPKNRSLYMAHAAYTQLSSSSPDDLQSRLALSLARKAVSERFDDDKELDCRVPGQIFALQKSVKDLDSILERSRLRESKQVSESLRAAQAKDEDVGSVPPDTADPSNTSPREWLVSEVAALKKSFAILVKVYDLPILRDFAANSTRLFHTAVTSLGLSQIRATAETCFLAISALVMIYSKTQDRNTLLHAAFLAETLLEHNDHVHEARMILVYIYMRLNLGSLAMRFFESLHIKEIQNDTVGHVLFSRISTLLPFSSQVSRRTTYDPIEWIYRGIGIYRRHEDNLADTEASILDHAQTGMIFDLHTLRDHLRSSWSRRMLVLEYRRLARFTNKVYGNTPPEATIPRAVAAWANNIDNRDFHATFDYGFSVEKALYCEDNVLLGDQWLFDLLLVDTAWCISEKQAPLIADAEELLKVLPTSPQAERKGSSAQRRASEVTCKVLQVLLATQSGSIPGDEDISSVSARIAALPINELTTANDDMAEHLPDHYTYIDTMKICISACRFLQDKSKSSSSALQQLQDTAKKSIGQLQKNARERASSLRIEQIQTRLSKDESMREAIQAFGTDAIQSFSENVMASAKEGWLGVTKLPAI